MEHKLTFTLSLLFFLLVIITFFIHLSSAIVVFPYDSEFVDESLREVYQEDTIQPNGDLHSNLLIILYIDQKDNISLPKNFSLRLDFKEGKKYFIPENININISKDVPTNPPSIPFTPEIENGGESITISIDTSSLKDPDKRIKLKLSYILKNFIFSKQGDYDYYYAWIRTECGLTECEDFSNVRRIITLPSINSIPESYYNLNFINLDEGKEILETKGWGEAIVIYRDGQQIRKEKNSYLIIGAFLSFLFSLLLIISRAFEGFSNTQRIIMSIILAYIILSIFKSLIDLDMTFFMMAFFLILIFVIIYIILTIINSRRRPMGLSQIENHYIKRGLEGRRLREALEKDIIYQKILKQKREKAKIQFKISKSEEKRYVLGTSKDIEILGKIKKLEKIRRLSKEDKKRLKLIKSQLEHDWRLPLEKELNNLIKKYKISNID